MWLNLLRTKKMQNASPVPKKDDKAGPAQPGNVFEAEFPITHSGKQVSKVRYMDFGEGVNSIRVVFDAESGETLGVMRPI